jgi:hypothetical protein
MNLNKDITKMVLSNPTQMKKKEGKTKEKSWHKMHILEKFPLRKKKLS